MFANFEVIDSNNYILTVTMNVTHITSLELINPRNPDSGTLINMRDGRQWESGELLCNVVNKVNDVIDRFGNQILVSYLAEQMPQPKKKPVKKRTYKTVKY